MLVQVMQKICRESEASLDYYSLFKAIMKRVPVPMSPLESLASSAVRTAHKVGLPHNAAHTRPTQQLNQLLLLQVLPASSAGCMGQGCGYQIMGSVARNCRRVLKCCMLTSCTKGVQCRERPLMR